ncbi:hypothetical protein EDM00_10880 [Ornithobacterium rhinotracheale]|uniref:phage head morphogenesis protein n=1 Tax=Ornithobacterium rhinotracheale TaxID=28251 RepID=UPI00129C7397|nr:phage minor head protein [Ornithobacterium rhinotracheale]MRI64485.1 hypothetical protein [Ornithobacterium rhinotracheale]
MGKFKQVLNYAEKAFKTLYEKQGYRPEDLAQITEYKGLINKTAEILSEQIPHETPAEMRQYLEQDVFVFSGLKTHAQLTEARSFLKDEKGNLRAYHDFEQKILKLNERYNRHYLEAEYEFAAHSAISASQWANLENDTERYWLEYRTAGDERVRASHDALRGVCLPKTDPFWDSFYPPNGWRCRCVAIEVLAREKTPSDSQKAQEIGEKATTQIGKNGNNKLAMFRFNAGKNKKIFPPESSYTKVVGAERAKKAVEEIGKEKENIFKDLIKKLKEQKIEYKKVFPLKNPLTEKEIIKKVGGGDLTEGSCASLSFAYAGNKLGFDVLDFRGGESRSFFARKGNLIDIAKKAGAFLESDYSDYKAVKKLLANVVSDKEYILITGAHSSVIRKSKEAGWQYLELQAPSDNGYKKLTNNDLKNRFGCKALRTSYGQKLTAQSILIDIEKLNNENFKEILGFINTAEAEQIKGEKGRKK